MASERGPFDPDPERPNGWFCLTRKGAALRTSADLETYRQGNLLPIMLLRPKIAENDVAVFQAFKEIEAVVRAAAKTSNSDIGRKLMQAAFNPDSGPLTDTEAELGQREIQN